jgi:hypothetical protein
MRVPVWRASRIVAVLALAASILPVVAGTSGAIQNVPIDCTAAGTITFVKSLNGIHWEIPAAKGSCEGDLNGTYFLDMVGSGSSDSAAICDDTFVVTGLDINVTATLTNAATGIPRIVHMEWTAPPTTYPVATPFIINTVEDGAGAGVWFNHIFAKCAGSPVAQFDFSFLS